MLLAAVMTNVEGQIEISNQNSFFLRWGCVVRVCARAPSLFQYHRCPSCRRCPPHCSRTAAATF